MNSDELVLTDGEILDFRRQRATQDLYDRIIIIIVGTFILTTVLILNQSPPAGAVYGYLWYAAALAIQTFGAGLLWAYRRFYARFSLNFWRGMYLSGVSSLALLWGVAGILFFNAGEFSQQMLLFTLIVGVTISSVSTNAVWLQSHTLFLVITTSPMIYMCLNQADPQYQGMGYAFLAYVLVSYFVARSASSTFNDMMALTLKNIRLAETLGEQYRLTEAASRAKTQFLAAASHDLRQPVHSLSLLAESLKQETGTPRGQQLISNITSAVTSIDDLLGKLLDISRLDAGDVKADISTFALDSLIGSIVREATPVAEEKPLTLVAIPCECIVRSDPVLLGNILRNLIANAIKYTESGTITVGTEPSQTEDGKFITRLYVRDTGMGIPQDQQDHIFQEFVQLNNPERDRQKGLGLGLSVCRRLSDLLGHSLRLVSSPGLGSEFSLDIELVSENIAPAVAESYASENPVGDFTGTPVLLVEDDAMVRQSTSELLAGWGCDVRAFADATTCIHAVGESPGWGDILITDFRLPGEMDGQELTGKVRQLTGRDLPVLMVTGDTAPERIKALSSSGMAVLHKPVKPAFLRNAMRQILTQ